METGPGTEDNVHGDQLLQDRIQDPEKSTLEYDPISGNRDDADSVISPDAPEGRRGGCRLGEAGAGIGRLCCIVCRICGAN